MGGDTVNTEVKLNKEKLVLGPAPHLHTKVTARRIMFDVIIALLPAVAAALYFFGVQALAVIAGSLVGAVGTEALIERLRGRPVPVGDGSAAVTGILLALCLPPGVPLWLAVLGGAFAVSVGKALFGGLGCNIFNPALVGRAFLLASFPVLLTTWRWPGGSELPSRGALDTLAGATPLELLRWEGVSTSLSEMFLGRVAGCLGETSVLALLIGASYLLARGVIEWRIPGAYLGTVVVMSVLMGTDPAFHLFAGGLVLGAFFMATDYSSSPVTPRGRIWFGVGCGILTMLIRMYGGYPEGVSYAILLMNAAVPLIESRTRPRPFGMEADNGG